MKLIIQSFIYIIDVYYFRYHHILENKQTSVILNFKKREAWDSVCQQYNTVAGSGFRTWRQLRHLYENLKQRAKKNIAKENVISLDKLCLSKHFPVAYSGVKSAVVKGFSTFFHHFMVFGILSQTIGTRIKPYFLCSIFQQQIYLFLPVAPDHGKIIIFNSNLYNQKIIDQCVHLEKFIFTWSGCLLFLSLQLITYWHEYLYSVYWYNQQHMLTTL